MEKKKIVSAVCLATMLSTTSVYSIAAAEKPVTQTSSRATNVLKASDNDDQKALKAKEAAKKELTAYANSIKDKVNSDNTLTTEEKKSAVDKIDKALARAINQVNILHTHKYVDLIKREMKQKIGEASVVKNKIKDISKKVIDEELKKQFKIINEADDSTMEEKNKAIESAKKEAEKAKKNIDNAKTNTEVQKAKNDGVAEIHKSNPESKVKETAKKTIDSVAKEQLDKIVADKKVKEEERQMTIKKVDEEVRKAKADIDNAKTNKEVEDIKNKVIAKIKNISIKQKSAKEDAKKELTDYAEKAKTKINSDSTLTDEEKKTAVEKVDTALNSGLSQIDSSTIDDFIDTIKQKVKGEIDKAVNPENKAKDIAKKSIDEELAKQSQIINEANDSTTEEKNTAVEKVKDVAKKAKANIDNAKTNNDVQKAKNDGVAAIHKVNPEIKIKLEAKKALDEAKKNQIKSINDNKSTTESEKQTAIDRVNEETKKGIFGIVQAKTNKDVENAKNDALTKIKDIKPESKAKTDAKKVVEETAKEQIKKINTDKNSTKEEKDEAINKINNEVMKAKTAIDNVKTSKDIENAKDNGVKQIMHIVADTNIKTPLKKAVENKSETIKTKTFKKAKKEKQDAYLKAIEEGQRVLNNPKATKKDVEDANKAIELAKKSLDGIKQMGHNKAKDKAKENGKIKEKVKESNRTNESNKSKNSKNPNGQKNSKGNLPKTSYASGIVGYGVSVLASVLGAFAIGKKRKED